MLLISHFIKSVAVSIDLTYWRISNKTLCHLAIPSMKTAIFSFRFVCLGECVSTTSLILIGLNPCWSRTTTSLLNGQNLPKVYNNTILINLKEKNVFISFLNAKKTLVVGQCLFYTVWRKFLSFLWWTLEVGGSFSLASLHYSLILSYLFCHLALDC